MLIGGHVNSARSGPGAFIKLDDARAGMRVQVVTADGKTRTYRVTSVREMPKASLPHGRLVAEGPRPPEPRHLRRALRPGHRALPRQHRRGRRPGLSAPSDPRGFVHEAELTLAPGGDERAPGGAVTVALCGSWEHEGPCRWPHHTEIERDGERVVLRTVFAVPSAEEGRVRDLIARALMQGADWTVTGGGPGVLTAEERALAARIARPM